MSAPNAVRTAGRGTVLRSTPSRLGPPRTRLPREHPPISTGVGRGAGALTHAQHSETAIDSTAGPGQNPKFTERSALAASVLKQGHMGSRRAMERRGDTASANTPFRSERRVGRQWRREKKAGVEDWFSSQERLEALEQFQVRTLRSENKTEASGVPFAWSNFDEGVKELPHGHWATPFVKEVVRSVQMNPQLDASMKERFLDETLKELSRLSIGGTTEERYQDAAE